MTVVGMIIKYVVKLHTKVKEEYITLDVSNCFIPLLAPPFDTS